MDKVLIKPVQLLDFVAVSPNGQGPAFVLTDNRGPDSGSTAGGLKGLQICGQFVDLGGGEPLTEGGHAVWTALADARAQGVGVTAVNEVWSLQ